MIADHELLEGVPVPARPDERAQRRVRGHEHAGGHVERAPQLVDGVRQPPAGREPLRAVQADREVTVAEVEPDLLAQGAQLVHRRERVVLDPPAALVDGVGEPERDQVGVGADVRAIDLDVVAGVGDDDQVGPELVQQAAGQLRASGAPGKEDDGCHWAGTL